MTVTWNFEDSSVLSNFTRLMDEEAICTVRCICQEEKSSRTMLLLLYKELYTGVLTQQQSFVQQNTSIL